MTSATDPVAGRSGTAVDRSPAARATGTLSEVGPPPAGSEETEKKGGKKKLLIVLAVVVLLGGVYMVKFRSHKPIYKPGEPVPAGAVLSLGSLTVNTSDGHIVQAGIDLQLTKPAVTKTVDAAEPKLLNAAILDLGAQTYTGLLAPTGKTALAQELLASFQQVLGPVDGAAPQVSAVYFTSFILQ